MAKDKYDAEGRRVIETYRLDGQKFYEIIERVNSTRTRPDAPVILSRPEGIGISGTIGETAIDIAMLTHGSKIGRGGNLYLQLFNYQHYKGEVKPNLVSLLSEFLLSDFRL